MKEDQPEEKKYGRGKIHLHPKANSNGFDKRPHDAQHTGRKPSIKKALERLLLKEGELKIPKSAIIHETEKFITIQMPKEDSIALRLLQWTGSSNGKTSLKAIEMIMTRMDGLALKDQQVETIAQVLSNYVVDDSHAEHRPPVTSEREASRLAEEAEYEDVDEDLDDDEEEY